VPQVNTSPHTGVNSLRSVSRDEQVVHAAREPCSLRSEMKIAVVLTLLRSRGEAVAAHYFGEGFGVGWGWWDRGGCGFGDDGDFAEVVRGEDTGADDGQRSGGGGVEIVEAPSSVKVMMPSML
jgi:hypothetical protein